MIVLQFTAVFNGVSAQQERHHCPRSRKLFNRRPSRHFQGRREEHHPFSEQLRSGVACCHIIRKTNNLQIVFGKNTNAENLTFSDFYSFNHV